MPDKLENLQGAVVNGNIPQIVMNVMSHALNLGASDIHIEPEESDVRIRYRIDGVLQRVIEYPLNIHSAVISRVKIMSSLKIDEQRIPQDGRIQVTADNRRNIDLRVSTLPTINGEKICMRIQDSSRKIPSLEELGISGNSLKFIREGIASPNGIVLNSGPTGSGKTTTLYSCLQELNTLDVNILTIEDPCEIQINGLNQSQVHQDIGYNFAMGLRSALRQDPDIIMVGEIRDKETIDVAVEAALTGHLVLSTIHTNSAVDTLIRISNMGVPNYLMVSTINAIIAQRLVRKVCEKCKEVRAPSPSELKDIQKGLENLHPDEKKSLGPKIFEDMKIAKSKGCDACGGIGYKGRIGLYEVLSMTDNLREHILREESTLEIKKIAMEEGLVPLRQAGIIKVLQQITTLEEVYQVTKK